MLDVLSRRSRKTTRKIRGGSTTDQTMTVSTIGPAAPWLIGPPLFLAGAALGRWVVTTDAQQALYGGLLVALTSAGAWTAWRYSAGNQALQRAHVAFTWMATPYAALVPMCLGVNRWVLLTGVPAWVVLCATWQARVSPAVQSFGQVNRGDEIAESLGLTGLVVKRVVPSGTPGKRPDRISSRWYVPAPKGYAEIAKVVPQIKNWAGAHFVRAARVADNPRAADLLVVMRDTLKTPTQYVHAPVSSFLEAIRIGTRIDGDPELFTVATDEGFARVLIAGCAGSGKTRTAWVIWAALSRCGAVWWIADPVKGGQSVGPAAGLFARVETDPDGTATMLSDLRQVIKNRSTLLGTRQTWEPGCGLAPMVVWFEEAAAVSSDSKLGVELTRIAESCRSVGVLLVVSQQRPSGKNMSTDARDQFTTSLCHGSDSPTTKTMVLSPTTVAAGACPEDWSDTAKGYHYAESAGVPREQWADPCRTLLISPEQLAAAVETAACGSLTAEELKGTSLDSNAPKDAPAPVRGRLDGVLDTLLGDDGTADLRLRTADLLSAYSPGDSSGAARKRLTRELQASHRVRDDGRGWWIITR